MYKFSGIVVFFVSISCTSLSQENSKSPAEQLYNYPGNVASVSWHGNKYFTPADSTFVNFAQCLVKNRKGLYAVLNGSGRLYKAFRVNDKLSFERIDTSPYYGSNFGSFNFSFRDTIYSLGGYGFWKTNGLLRYYIEQRHEWEIIKLNREIPVLTGNGYDLIWYDQSNGKLYFGFTKTGPGTTTDKLAENNPNAETVVLDLVKKEWQQLGTLSPFLKNDLTNISNIISSPFGQMIAFRNKNLFLDFAANKIYRFSDAKQREIEQLSTSSGDSREYYFIDSTFYSWMTSRKLVDSMNIGRNDLVLMDEKIYIPGQAPATASDKKAANPKPVLLTIAGLIAALSLGYYLGRKRHPIIAVNEEQVKNGAAVNNGNDVVIPFSPLEIEVMQAIFENSRKGSYTSIDELNKVLGVSKKNIDIQKKQRSDIISSVNKKFSYYKQSKQELIEKNRTEFDKRSFEYFIDPSRLVDADNFIKSNDSAVQP